MMLEICPSCDKPIKAGEGEWVRDEDGLLQFVHDYPSCTRGYERLSVANQPAPPLSGD